MNEQAFHITVKELVEAGKTNIAKAFSTTDQLIYNSPATLAFNSPGAQGFGVKRAGLSLPGSIMLLIGPPCCGRNTAALGADTDLHDRFFYYIMDETDIVTGRHLTKIPQAVVEICQDRELPPSVVMLCLTCVDALLGTDMERVCRKAEKLCGIPVVPCYMYALTREGRKPPMVAVRQSLYSLLKPRFKISTTVNIMGFFSPLIDSCELYDLLRQAGIKTINELSRCKTFEEYQHMSQANFNLVLNPEARLAAVDMEKRLKIPFIELTRLYQIDKIHTQYAILGKILGIDMDDRIYYDACREYIEKFKIRNSQLTFAIGENINGNPFEMALALRNLGYEIKEIFSSVNESDFVYLRQLAKMTPDTKVLSNISPTMFNYKEKSLPVDIAIGKDASYYHPEALAVNWHEEQQPFGYVGLQKFLETIQTKLVKGAG